MRFLITGTDTSGSITLRRETAAAALKKAAELAEDGCLDVAITAPDGHRFPSDRFDGVCTENLNPNVLTMKSAQYGARIYDAGSLNLARDRRIFVQ
jgi:hypothetical protein